ncbi:transcriptional regulator with HTH domain and aminotransferase domain [Jonquetella anthropi DSM 22815]|uniref:Transcriptional regulator with HTH domain and aminotransferase domain n=1 Tax=Jonquetella anthropi DSM 22815 TaxID=885272 RepID=H0UJG9_9BACT|nr:PLP-dependent aminotransferase family protein [Jonquetella anthropi]EHM13936.1 transcriptional regulator with HTH domain and aminotransferase domain [Jonquetella anthropi DSM 22815]
MIELALDRSAPTALYVQLADRLSDLIRCGALGPSERLPSSRSISADLGVSRQTAVDALSELVSRGLVTARGRSGFFVASGRQARDRQEWGALLHMDDDRPEGLMVPAKILSSAADALFSDHRAFVASPVAGWESLRRLLVRHSAARGIAAQWSHIFLTSGGRQGLSLALMALKERGVRHLTVPKLCWPGAPLCGEAEGFGISRLPSDDLTELAALGPADALYLNPSFSNPTGQTIELAERKAVLEASRRQGFWILEDDAYGELRYGPDAVPAFRAIASDGDRLVYLSSFSQALCPGLRLGYCLAPKTLHKSFENGLLLRSGPASSPLQLWLEKLIDGGGLERALSCVRVETASRMRTLWENLKRLTRPWSSNRPQGGIYLWLSTPETDGRELAERCFSLGLAIAPGQLFSSDGPVNAVRLSISSLSGPQIAEAVTLIEKASGAVSEN